MSLCDANGDAKAPPGAGAMHLEKCFKKEYLGYWRILCLELIIINPNHHKNLPAGRQVCVLSHGPARGLCILAPLRETGMLHLRMRKLSMEELNRKSVEEFKRSEKIPVIAVLENVRSAYNVGSVFRTADAFLIEAVYLCGYTAFPPHKEIKKTALGADETVTWKHFKKMEDAFAALKDEGYKIYAVEQAEGSYKLQAVSFKPREKMAVIFGNEVTGVEQSTIIKCDGCIEIPQLGMKHSLNVSVAAGVVLWELVKQYSGKYMNH